MKATRADMRIAHPMPLPGTRHGQVVRLQAAAAIIHRESDAAALQEGQFEAFVAMPVQAPILRAARVPKPDRLDAGERAVDETASRVMATRQRCQLHAAAPHRVDQRLAGVGLVFLAMFLVDGQQHDV